MYKIYVDASKKINDRWLDNNRAFFRYEPPIKIKDFHKPENFSKEKLLQSFSKLLEKIKPPKPLPKTSIDKSISIKSKIEMINKILFSKKKTSFLHILNESKNRTEIIVGFLAILELVKNRQISLKQNKNFSDILIEKI